MEPVIAESARKWGVADEDMLHAYRNAFRVKRYDDGFTMVYGSARNAVTILEVGYVIADDDVVVIVHAMETTDYRLR